MKGESLKDFIRRKYFNNEDVENLDQKVASYFLSKCMFIIAIIMIAYGALLANLIILGEYSNEIIVALNAISIFFGGGDISAMTSNPLLQLPPALAYVVCGILIFLDSHRNFIKSVGLYAICVGFARAYASFPLMVSQTELTFISGVVMFALGSNIVYSGYSMLSGKVRGRTSMMISSALLLLSYVEYLALLVYIDVGNNYATLRESMRSIFQDYPTMVVSCFMFITLIWLLDSDEIRYGDNYTRHIRILRYVDNTYRSPEELVLSEDDARTLLDMDSEGWYSPGDDGPVEKEYYFESRNSHGTARAYVQKWKGHDKLYMTLAGTPKGTMVYAKRFEIQQLYLSSDDVQNSDNIDILVNNGQILHATITHIAPNERMTGNEKTNDKSAPEEMTA